MSQISININLRQLQHAISVTPKGNKVIIIPLEINNLIEGEKGVYLNITAFELKEKRDKDTHLLKQSLPKEKYNAISEEERKAMPILGNAIVWDQSNYEPEPKGQQVNEFKQISNDDIPF